MTGRRGTGDRDPRTRPGHLNGHTAGSSGKPAAPAPAGLRRTPAGPEISTPEWLASLAAASRRMPVPAVMRPPEEGGRRSAVLILFGEGERGPDVLLIQRNNGLRRHSGQPAFPGGSMEPSDSGPEDCALREAQEETGADPAGIELLGRLPELYINRSGFRVQPVLAWWRTPSDVHPADPGEVAGVVRVPVADLADPANRVRVREPGGAARPGFRVGGMLVWGFTAAILDRLLVLGGWERPWLDTALEEALPMNGGTGAGTTLRPPAPNGPNGNHTAT